MHRHRHHHGCEHSLCRGALLSGAVNLTAATEGVSLPGSNHGPTFTDSNPIDVATSFTASITWGDGTTTASIVSGSNGSFTVTGGHTYPDEGKDTLSTTITRSGSGQLVLTGGVDVAEGDALTPQSPDIAVNPNTWFTTAPAKFSDSDTSNVASAFSATINWGDGTKTAGTLTDLNGAIMASRSHTFTAAGQFPVAITLADDTPGTASATVHGTASVDADTRIDLAPTLTIASKSLTVSPGNPVSLRISVVGFDPDDTVLVKISNIHLWWRPLRRRRSTAD